MMGDFTYNRAKNHRLKLAASEKKVTQTVSIEVVFHLDTTTILKVRIMPCRSPAPPTKESSIAITRAT